MLESKPSNCDVGETKDMSANGCTGVPSSFAVAGASQSANIIGACNNHDVCYGTLGISKATCDTNFHSDMITTCRATFGYPYNYVGGQMIINRQYANCAQMASAYYVGVTVINDLLAIVDQDFYNRAQNDAACNAWNEDFTDSGC